MTSQASLSSFTVDDHVVKIQTRAPSTVKGHKYCRSSSNHDVTHQIFQDYVTNTTSVTENVLIPRDSVTENINFFSLLITTYSLGNFLHRLPEKLQTNAPLYPKINFILLY